MRQAFHAGRPAQADEDYFARADGSVLPISWLITPYGIGDHHAATLVVFHTPEHPRDTGPRPEPTARSLSELQRLALLAETTAQLTSTLDVDEALQRLVALVVPRLADWVVVDLITERDEVLPAVPHCRTEQAELIEGNRERFLEDLASAGNERSVHVSLQPGQIHLPCDQERRAI